MAASGCTAIAIEAHQTLLIEKEKLAHIAKKLSISVIGFQAGG